MFKNFARGVQHSAELARLAVHEQSLYNVRRHGDQSGDKTGAHWRHEVREKRVAEVSGPNQVDLELVVEG